MESPYETYNNQIGVRLSFVVAEGHRRFKVHKHSLQAISYDAYEKRAKRNENFRLREGKGTGNEALLRWESLPHDWQHRLLEKFGDPKKLLEKCLLEDYYGPDAKAVKFYSGHKLPDGTPLKPKKQIEYCINAAVLNAVIALKANRTSKCRSMGITGGNVWDVLGHQLELFREKTDHTLKAPSLRRTVRNYLNQGYKALISGKEGNQNTARIKDERQFALIEELLKKHNNFNDEQIREKYNEIASLMEWKLIETAGTIANYRKKLDLHTYSGRRGETNFDNTRAMQNKRKAPSFPLYYWTMDGWDVELLYQRTAIDEKGNSNTTYHNRLTAVVVLDPCCKYPVGYAIGTHETPALIKEALRNAANHTGELFGNRYKPLQLQTDNYAIKTLKPLYEAITSHFTPARVKNAKAKVVEPYFGQINRKYCQALPNWSGFGVTGKKENQPNADYLNKIRHQFPDEAGCRAQIEHLIWRERAEKQAEYVAKWQKMPEENRLPLSQEEYLYLFGETHAYTNRLNGNGFTPTLLGQERCYDSFDMRFRELLHVDWAVKYDPADLSRVLVVNAETKGKGKELDRLVDTQRFLLEDKYLQPMALVERTEGDAAALQRVNNYNEHLKEQIVERGNQNRQVLEELFGENPQLNGTLTKLILTDSSGQHKNQRNATRAVEAGQSLIIKEEKTQARQQRKEAKQEADQAKSLREAYINSKFNMSDLINL
jgi:hypothetical protein